MNRKEFIKTCGISCLGIVGAGILLEGCASTKYVNATLAGSFLEIPLTAFEANGKKEMKFLRYVIAQHDDLKYPICVYRQSETNYQALLMRCTHQGTELQVFGDRLQCPAHGSEFSNNGEVKNGPAAESLRTFPLMVEQTTLKINLS